MVDCPICGKQVRESLINQHIDSSCKVGVADDAASTASPVLRTPGPKSFFSTQPVRTATETPVTSKKRSFTETQGKKDDTQDGDLPATVKKPKVNAFAKAAPLAERMRPKSLDDVCGQDLVGENGVLRGLIEQDRVPSMVLWGSAGTGKTTIARLVAHQVNARFIEINASEAGVAEVKKIFAEAKAELGLTGRKTIIFCDEIHRFSKSQQDVFLGPVEAGTVTLIGATTENPSFKIQNALLSRCRTFTLSKLNDTDIEIILSRALEQSREQYNPNRELVNEDLLRYLAAFADGDARTALNLLELAMDLASRPNMHIDTLKAALTKTLVYDRAGDQHYDSISAFHKSVRGSNADAALYYLARMIQSGEDALYIARRMVVIASEDVGLADNSMLTLATSTYSACEKIGLPECKINLAHCTVALCTAPKSTRAYRGLKNAMTALQEPGVAGLPIPTHLRNAPTKLMKELGYGKEYKYNPQYLDGRVKQDYLPEQLLGRKFLEDRDLGTETDPDLDDLNVKEAILPPSASSGEHQDHNTTTGSEITGDGGLKPDDLKESITSYSQVNGQTGGEDLHGPEPDNVETQQVDEDVSGKEHAADDTPLSSQTKPPEEWE